MRHLSIDPAALLMLATVIYFKGFGHFAAVMIAGAVHELGHIAALNVMGERITALSLGKSGLSMEYTGVSSALPQTVAALMGPAVGIIFAMLASSLSPGEPNFWKKSADASIALSVFNLLPVLPLDGGRVTLAVCTFALGNECGRRAADIIGNIIKAAVLLGGIILAVKAGHFSLLAMAIWLLAYSPERDTMRRKETVLLVKD